MYIIIEPTTVQNRGSSLTDIESSKMKKYIADQKNNCMHYDIEKWHLPYRKIPCTDKWRFKTRRTVPAQQLDSNNGAFEHLGGTSFDNDRRLESCQVWNGCLKKVRRFLVTSRKLELYVNIREKLISERSRSWDGALWWNGCSSIFEN